MQGMLPVLSTRAFGRVPRLSDLDLARRLRFLDLELWLQPFARGGPGLEGLADDLVTLGLRAPCVHLPVGGLAGALDVDAPDPVDRREALDAFAHALDDARRVGAHVAVAHVRGAASDGLGRLLELAEERGLRLALETDTLPGSDPASLLRALHDQGSLGRGHGLCIDLARTRLGPTGLRALGSRLAWLEVSQALPGQPHAAPEESDQDLRVTVEACSLPAVAYEVVPVGPENVPAGEAQLTMLLRRVAAFHLGAGTPAAAGVAPFVPMG